jgi:hypothetical protein
MQPGPFGQSAGEVPQTGSIRLRPWRATHQDGLRQAASVKSAGCWNAEGDSRTAGETTDLIDLTVKRKLPQRLYFEDIAGGFYNDGPAAGFFEVIPLENLQLWRTWIDTISWPIECW